MIVYFQIMNFNEKKKWFQCYFMVGDQKRESMPPGDDPCILAAHNVASFLGAAAAPGPVSRPGASAGPTRPPWAGTRPGPGARPATAATTTTASLPLFKDPDPSPSKLGTIQLVQSILHVPTRPKLSNSLSTLMSVCIVDFSCLTHEVLQVLPGGGGGEVLHHDAISSPCTRWPPSTESTPVAISTSEVTTTTTTSL